MFVTYRGETVECEVKGRHAYFSDGSRAKLAKTKDQAEDPKFAVLIASYGTAKDSLVAKVEDHHLWTSERYYIRLSDPELILKPSA